ncbi:hypothetical protein ABKA04_005610 [Annulohypoxylon sp. FPYF3050]
MAHTPSAQNEKQPDEDETKDVDEIRELVRIFLRNHTRLEKPKYDVAFRNLTVRGAGIGHQTAPTVPTALASLAQNLNPKLYLSNRPQPSRTLLYPMSGIIRGGETLMVIGKPGSGCTTFLKTLANMREEYKAVEGDVWYNGRRPAEMKSLYPGEVAYAGEDDIHFHSLSVNTTLRFALNARTPVDLPNHANQLDEDVQTLLKLFDLTHVANVPVGNDYIRGVSGGQRHRVTLAETFSTRARHYRIHFTDRSTWVAEAAGTIAQAIMLGTLFRDQQAVTKGIYTRSSALFFCVLIMCLQASAEFGNTFAQRPILLKQRALCFYRPGAYALGQILADIPWKVIFIIYSLPIYWMVNFKREAGAFFIWFFTLYVALMSLGVMFRTIAVFTTTPTRAILPVGILMNSLIIYTGFYVNPPGMKVWLGWLRYLDPMYYALESVMLNEFLSSGYQCSAQDTVPRGPDYSDTAFQVCAVESSVPGNLLLSGRRYLEVAYTFFQSNLWRNIGINAAFFGFFALCVTIGMERFKTPAGRMSTIFYSTSIEKKEISGYTSRVSDEEMLTGQDTDGSDNSLRETHTPCNQTMTSSKRHFAWKDLCLDVQVGGENRRLLDNVSGWLEPGTMTALMGMSGAGKTTLLDTLSQRSSIGVVTGGLYLDNDPLPQSMNRRSGFVQQQDVHLSTSTVREALQLTAQLRQPASIPISEKYEYVETVITMLEMEDVADALIGTPGTGLNLEKRKRVSIGVELAAKPDILLFLDEPTSGLDGDSAFSIISLMRKLANAGQTILCTIHQPSFDLIEQFDSLLLLIPGGKTAYFGPMGPKCKTLTGYFGRYTRPCRETENPADYVLDLTANKSVDWASIWLQSPEHEAAQQSLKGIISTAGSDYSDDKTNTDQDALTYATSPWEQLRVVLRRAFLNYWRDPDYLSDSMDDARNRLFSIFIGIITGPVLTLQIEPRFTTFRDQFLAREKESHVYHWSVFILSTFLVEIPFTLVGGLLYWLLWYYMAGYFYSSERAGYAFLMYELYQIFVASIAQLISSVFPTLSGAQVATGFVWLMINTFNGPLSPPPLTPKGWRWFYNVSPTFYFVEGIATNAMHGLDIRCSESEISKFRVPGNQTCGEYTAAFFDSSDAQGYLLNATATSDCAYCPYANGDEYLKQYDFNYSNRGRNIGIFIGFIMFNYTMAALATYLIFIFKCKLPKVSFWKK